MKHTDFFFASSTVECSPCSCAEEKRILDAFPCFFLFKVENKELKKRILNDPVTYPEKFSESARSICEGLLHKEVDKRLGFRNGSCDELRAHQFFSEINWRKLNAGQCQTQTSIPTVCTLGLHQLYIDL